MNYSRLFVVLGFIFIGVMSRFIPHPPNFTAIISMALFSATSFKCSRLSLLCVCAAMFCSDLVIGFHSQMLFVYISLGLIVWMGRWIRSNTSTKQIPCFLVASSLLFFAITNFGAWLTIPFYPKTLEGLVACYVAAIPFLTNQILGDLVYGAMLFGCFAFAERCVPAIRLQQSNY